MFFWVYFCNSGLSLVGSKLVLKLVVMLVNMVVILIIGDFFIFVKIIVVKGGNIIYFVLSVMLFIMLIKINDGVINIFGVSEIMYFNSVFRNFVCFVMLIFSMVISMIFSGVKFVKLLIRFV